MESDTQKRPRVFFDISIDNIPAGRIVFELYNDLLPKTCENFYHLCVGDKGIGRETHKPLHYKDCVFHRIVKNFVAQSGDFSHGTGVGGESIWGGQFADEAFPKRHYRAGMLSMANSGLNTNGSQFVITLARVPSLDNKHVAFGHIKEGQSLLDRIGQVPTDRNDAPMGEVRIARCGDYSSLLLAESAVIEGQNSLDAAALRDRREETRSILAESGAKKTEKSQKELKDTQSPRKSLTMKDLQVGPNVAKMSAREKRFYDLQLRFRADARKTKKEVMTEYRRLNSKGKSGPKASKTKRFREGKEGGKASHIVSLTASEAQKIYEKRAEKDRRRADSGQTDDRAFSAYVRKVEGLEGGRLHIADEENLVDENSIDVLKNVTESREDVERLSKEIKRNQEKRKNFSRRRKYNEDRDISFINRRNEAFNAKVARAFDKYTYEIKANLERGTAL